MAAGHDESLPRTPIDAISEGDFPDVPILYGSVRDEWRTKECKDGPLDRCLFVSMMPMQMEPDVNITLTSIGSETMRAFIRHMGVPVSDDRWEADIASLYPVEGYSAFSPGSKSMARVADMMTDLPTWFGSCNSRFTAKMLARRGARVWLYLFDHPGRYASGSGHSSDIAYLFQNCQTHDCQGSGGDNHTDRVLMRQMGQALANFAANGDPTLRHTPDATTTQPSARACSVAEEQGATAAHCDTVDAELRRNWPRYTAGEDAIVRFALPLSRLSRWNHDRCAFWYDVFDGSAF
jgi:carboxylesterase type B